MLFFSLFRKTKFSQIFSSFQSSRLIAVDSIRRILAIETSCDDTCAAILEKIDSNPSEHLKANILAENVLSQAAAHLKTGGIVPPIARDLHQQNIHNVIHDCFQKAQLQVKDIDAIAVTTRPGLALSLSVGLSAAKRLAVENNKPILPIHHMEAHALMARHFTPIAFPYLTLLISGGHCQLVWIENAETFFLLGRTLDVAPGDALDKFARRLDLKSAPGCSHCSGGVAIEKMAATVGIRTDLFITTAYMSRNKNCDFSFSGILQKAVQTVDKLEKNAGDVPVDVFCASFQHAVALHLARRLERGLLFCRSRKWSPSAVVVSGGVASNLYIRSVLQQVVDHFRFRLVCPPPAYCTDNAVMIGWNGLELCHAKSTRAFVPPEHAHQIDFQAKCSLGLDIRHEVEAANISLIRVPIKTAT